MEKKLLSGNEAIALGAYQAGATVGVGYPGTPSTEILENYCKYDNVYAEWSVNEKVALEVGIGASLSGARTLVTMKHVGVNVAADPLFTLSYMGVKGGLVIVSADDPNMHSSQNEQDNRNYALAAKIPMLEPSNSEEARIFTRLAFDISEQYDTPVFIRPTTRICHSQSVVNVDIQDKLTHKTEGFSRNPKKYVMIPAFARARHFDVEDRMNKLQKDADKLAINRMEINDKKRGFITSGIAYKYVKETYPEASILKLGMVWPLPKKLIQEFVDQVENVIIFEELDPFIETQVKAMGLKVEGKKFFPVTGEFNPDTVKKAFGEYNEPPIKIKKSIPPRPPALCPGCPHIFVFQTLNNLGVYVGGDIGCYTLGVLPPYSSIDSCVDMGASVTVTQGINIVEPDRKSVSVIGDSTFAHSGVTGLINAAYNKRNHLIIVLDNSTTAMTGMQPNPFSGNTITGEPAHQVDYYHLAKAVGIDDECYKTVDAYKKEDIKNAITTLLDKNKLSLLVVKGICVIYKRKKGKK